MKHMQYLRSSSLVVISLSLFGCAGHSYITSNPSAATVTLNGEYLGLTPLQAVIREKGPAAEYSLAVSKHGYVTQTKTFKEMPLRFAKGTVPSQIHFELIRDESEESSPTQFVISPTGDLPIVNYTFNERTGKGSLTVDLRGKGINARHWVVENIGKICSDKNITLIAGEETHRGGHYRVLNESAKEGLLTIEFEASW